MDTVLVLCVLTVCVFSSALPQLDGEAGHQRGPEAETLVQDVPLVTKQDDGQPLSGTVIIRPPKIEKVTHVTSSNQYQKLYPTNGKYKFGYDDETQFRVEERLGNGQLRGYYGFVDENGNVTAYRYSYDGYSYKQEPFRLTDIPDDLRFNAQDQEAPQRNQLQGPDAERMLPERNQHRVFDAE